MWSVACSRLDFVSVSVSPGHSHVEIHIGNVVGAARARWGARLSSSRAGASLRMIGDLVDISVFDFVGLTWYCALFCDVT